MNEIITEPIKTFSSLLLLLRSFFDSLKNQTIEAVSEVAHKRKFVWNNPFKLS